MAVTPEDVRYVARLARLSFTAGEEERLAGDLTRILDYVRLLDELDLDDVQPLDRVGDRDDALREDTVVERIRRAEALASSPDADDQYFRVPKVVG